MTLVEQLRRPCGVCKSNDLNDTLLTVNAKCARCFGSYTTLCSIWYIVRLDSSRVATLVKVRSVTLVLSGDPTRVESSQTIYKYRLRFYGKSNAAQDSQNQMNAALEYSWLLWAKLIGSTRGCTPGQPNHVSG